jgi:starch-binding outer membrane protein, SusD/RagB family
MEFHMLNRIATSGRGLRLLPRRALGLAAVAAVLPLAACNLDDALSIEDPFTVTPGTASDTVNLPNTYAGARARFATAIGGRQNTEGGYVLQTGTFTDELADSDGFGTRQAVDRRKPTETNAAVSYPYTYLQRARAEAVNAAALFASTSQAGSPSHANLYSIVGYSELMLAEGFCSGIPLSLVDNSGAFVPTAGLTTSAVLDSAIAAFDKALALAGSDATELNLARVGKARTLLFKGDYAGAAAVAALVPSNFTYFVEYDAGSQDSQNAVNQLLNGEKRWTTVDKEGTNGLDFMSSHDPRTPWGSATGTLYAPNGDGLTSAADGGIHFSQLKYPSQSSDILLASGMEARYIQAEAALRTNNTAGFLAQLNAARAANNALLPAATPLAALDLSAIGATQTEQLRTLMRERGFSLWLTGHRLGDLRRVVRSTAAGGWGQSQANWWPVGADRRGDAYDTDVVLTIPQDERNNPLYTGCLDMNP